MSSTEMPQVVIRKTRGQPRIPITWAQANTRIATHRRQLNETFRKFGFDDRQRQAHFFGQCVQETDYLQAMSEYVAFGADYAPYFGRGFTQLTWAKNYVSYGRFRGFAAPTTFTAANFPAWFARFRNNWYDGRPSAAQIQQQGRAHFVLDGKTVPSWDVEIVATDAFVAVDSGGFYWVWKALADSNTGRRTGQQSIVRLADAGFLQADVDEVTYNINGGWNGRDIRRLTGPYAWAVLNDTPLPAGFERQVP
jgi:predicted chitinase